jgi:hypothetical protein
MSPPHFPIGPEGLQGSWRIRAALPGVLAVGAALVTVAPALHKGGATIGIRVDLDGGSMAYLPDHALTQTAPAGAEPHGATTLEALVDGVDVLLHDGQFLPGERALATAYGHATVDAVMALADRCGVGRLVLTHHAPTRTDDALDLLAGTVTATPGGRPVTIARQDDVLHVAGAALDPGTAAATGAAASATPPRHDR